MIAQPKQPPHSSDLNAYLDKSLHRLKNQARGENDLLSFFVRRLHFS